MEKNRTSRMVNDDKLYQEAIDLLLNDKGLTVYLRDEGYLAHKEYAGGTLVISPRGMKDLMIFVNISSETYSVICPRLNMTHQRLMDIPQMIESLLIYTNTKGVTEYFKECFNKSSVRYILMAECKIDIAYKWVKNFKI